jgi:hypothetical protein
VFGELQVRNQRYKSQTWSQLNARYTANVTRSRGAGAANRQPPEKNDDRRRRRPTPYICYICDLLTCLPTFFLTLFLVRFWAFLGKESSKTPWTYFYEKSMSKTFYKTKSKKKCQFFLERFLPKYSPKHRKPNFSRFCLSYFWAFLGDGSSKTP